MYYELLARYEADTDPATMKESSLKAKIVKHAACSERLATSSNHELLEELPNF